LKLDNWLEQRARTSPDRMAVIGPDGDLTYAELESEARSLARRLVSGGARRGGTVALTMSPGTGKVVLVHALMKAGAVLMPLSDRLTPAERSAAVAAAGVDLDLGEPAGPGGVEADMPLLGEHDMDEVHSKLLTSGSTGTPRTVSLTYGNHLFSAMGSAFNLGVEPTDRWLCALPMSHISGLSISMRSAIYGTGMVLHDRFDPEAVARSLEDDGVTVISLVATMLRRLLDEGVDLSRTRAVLVGGGPVPPDVLEEALGVGAPVVQTYGMTETCSQVTTLTVEDAPRKIGSAGRPLLTSHLRIEDGEILVQGPTVSPSALDSDGWLRTGDLGRIDDEGFLFVEGRADATIITGGENVGPEEVEAVLREHPAVQDAAVIGVSDPEWQQKVVALVVPTASDRFDREAVLDHCAALLAPYKVPKQLEVVSELPKTASGKLRRGDLEGLFTRSDQDA
jgi:O-succinylbenzoic acid--CoA ligase